MKRIAIITAVILLVGCKSNKQNEYAPYSGGAVPLISVNSSQPKVLDWDNAIEVASKTLSKTFAISHWVTRKM